MLDDTAPATGGALALTGAAVPPPVDGRTGPAERRGAGPRWWPPRSRYGAWNAAAVAVPAVLFAVLGWQRRWMSDDGLIVLRTVRNVLAGNGPVFNPGERVEVNTSAAWTALLTVVGWVGRADLAWTAVVTGLVCSVLGLALGLDGARRLHAPDGDVALLPVGAAVLLALPPVRDFATSGLETGLVTLWLAGSWWLLVRVARGEHRGAVPWAAAIVLGLGPLVRPELAVVPALGVPLLIALVGPSRWRLVGLVAAAGALPLAYQVFRAGYYGLLVPNTALVKEASQPRWGTGAVYLGDTVVTYRLWVPLAAVLVLAALAVRRARASGAGWATPAVAVLPVVSGVLLALYVVRVGGDFMHGRMLLPALTAVALPVLAVPLARATLVPAVAVAAWLAACAPDLRAPYGGGPATPGITDERAHYVAITRHEHPVTEVQYVSTSAVRTSVPLVAIAPEPSLVVFERWTAAAEPVWRGYQGAAGSGPTTVVWPVLGTTGVAHPLDVRVLDGIGLAAPLASHAAALPDGRVGHDKDLPFAWFVADSIGGTAATPADPAAVAAARRALACPAVADVLASVRAPLTWERFRANLTGSVERTRVRWPREPERAAECGGAGIGAGGDHG